MSEEPEIKRLIGRAFDDGEPPLGIDRDEVFRLGRKRLRARRVFEASGVVACVVAAAVGAVTLTGIGGDGDQHDPMPPGASSTVDRPAPPGPTLPVDRPTSAPVTTPGRPADVESSAVPPTGREWQLTTAVYKSAPSIGDAVAFPMGKGRPAFQRIDDSYVLRGDVPGPDGWGTLEVVVVDAAHGVTADCATLSHPFDTCLMETRHGLRTAVATWDNDGEQGTIVQTVHPDGTLVNAMMSNLAARERASGRATIGSQVLSEDELMELATSPTLRVR